MSQYSTTTPTNRTRPSSEPVRYWCHQCGRESPIYMPTDPTCQRCNSQFIEEIDSVGDDPRNFIAGVTLDTDDDNDYGEFALGDAMFQSLRTSLDSNSNNSSGGRRRRDTSGHPLAQPVDENGEAETPMDAILQNLLSNLLTSGMDNDEGDHDDEDHEELQQLRIRRRRRTPMVFYRGMVDGAMQVTPLDITEGRQRTTARRRAALLSPTANDTQDDNDDERQGGSNNLQGLLQIISALAGTPMVGNPDDYVSSQAALDNIITQLMEQTGSASAPPPAPEGVILSLPRRALHDQEIEDQVDCAVCKDDFNMSDLVVELPCQHIFHDDCITPWLKMNGTCPVCRHSVISSTSTANQATDNNASSSSSSERRGSNQTTLDNGYVIEIDSMSDSYTGRRRSSGTQSATNNTMQPSVAEPRQIQHRTASTGPAAAPAFARLSHLPSSPWPAPMYPWGLGNERYAPGARWARQSQHPSTDPVDMDNELD